MHDFRVLREAPEQFRARRHLEIREFEPRGNRTAAQRPGRSIRNPRRLPAAGRHDRYGLGVRELAVDSRNAVITCGVDRVQLDRATGIEMPDLLGPSDAMECRKITGFQQEVDQRSGAALRVLAGGNAGVANTRWCSEYFAEVSAFGMRLEAEFLDDLPRRCRHCRHVWLVSEAHYGVSSERITGATMRIRRYIKVSIALLAAIMFALFALFSGSLYTWSVLTDEALVAELRFAQLGPQHFEAFIDTEDGCTHRSVEIFGDQWRIDARFLKWRNWALLLGLDAHYRLTRIEGRYARIEEQNTRRNLAWALDDEPRLDVVDLASDLGRLNVFVDSTYGSSTFQTIDPEFVYRVYRTQTGLIARQQRLPEDRAAREGLLVEVQSGCGAEPGGWQRFTRWLDRGIGRMLGRSAAG
jgi:hypothetical protein